jgi:membrane protein DedA with SNARE-associated domain
MAPIAVGLALATFVSEDLACVAAGLLIARGEITPAAALAGCAIGIWVGDIGLWVLGRTGSLAALRSRWLARRAPPARLHRIGQWIDQRAATALVVSRFVPGMRLPAYVVAGVVGVSLARFATWTAVAAIVWTPLLVLGGQHFGEWSRRWLSPVTAWGAPIGAVLLLMLLALARSIDWRDAHRRIDARLARWLRWEFWPMWLFYPPIAAWIGWLAVRHGGLSTMTAANPGIPDGGTVGESKAAILSALPAAWTIPHLLVPAGDLEARVRAALDGIAAAGWTYPTIMKPDVGQRGVGVRLISDGAALRAYLARMPDAVVVQPYHPGPFEAGVFYYRFPNWPSGRIFSITDKEFPAVVGDGTSTLSELIWTHPRYRMQAAMFLERHRDRAQVVVPAGEPVRLAVAGNHAQGTVFRDGAHLITPALERRIDQIARSYPGFFVGRFDIRYRSVDAFKAGEDLAIVELNGATAESTNIYDPNATIWSAYRTLFRQWSIVFGIGAANRARGATGSSLTRLARLVATHLTTRCALAQAD